MRQISFKFGEAKNWLSKGSFEISECKWVRLVSKSLLFTDFMLSAKNVQLCQIRFYLCRPRLKLTIRLSGHYNPYTPCPVEPHLEVRNNSPKIPFNSETMDAS